ncbi:response regulator [Variovorax sp. RT4R15]|uniref:response regulator n=1 Tax=Variovorax sp. RT4R15 TaxID=3443737 RepID=UPI003F483459
MSASFQPPPLGGPLMADSGMATTPPGLPAADRADHGVTRALAEPVNVLIVDDEPNNLTVLETVLDDSGYRLVHANSGEQALMALMAHEFAVLVLDVNMPDMSGFELAQLVKQRKKTASIPIIFLTAYFNDERSVVEGYGSGAVDYLHKPVNVNVLRSKVSVFAELYRKGRALEEANRALVAEIAERRTVEERLRELNETLERRVLDRTEALEASEAQLRSADRRKDEFLATLAHELRNPLAPIGYAVRLLGLKGPATPEVVRASDLIGRQVKAMSRLIDDLMDVSRINQGKIQLHRERILLASVLRDAIDAARPVIDECKHELQVALPAQEVALEGDATRLAQAFMNLLHNASKYMDSGGQIAISVLPRGQQVEVTVRDTGIGIAADRLESIFEMFSQVDAALSRSRGGLGIGLSLTRRLVELHGGTIVARSEGTGRGSEFVVSLPMVDAPPAGAAVFSSQGAGSEVAPFSALRVLVADDNQDAAEALTELLRAMGHCVRCVFDGEAAVSATREFDPELILLDIGMPKLNGYEACRAIRADRTGRRIWICAVTGWGQPEDLRMASEAGFDRHLVKPLDPDTLLRLIGEVVAGGGGQRLGAG